MKSTLMRLLILVARSPKARMQARDSNSTTMAREPSFSRVSFVRLLLSLLCITVGLVALCMFFAERLTTHARVFSLPTLITKSGEWKDLNSALNRASDRVTAQSEENDPDIPPFARGRIDDGTYLRLREEHIVRLRGLDLDKPFDPRARGRAIQQMEGQVSRLAEIAHGSSIPSPLAVQGAWTALGPAPIPNGQVTGGSTTTPVSGRVTAIAVHPTNPNIAYLGTAQGGLWRTTDGGASWLALMDTAQSLAIGAVTIEISCLRVCCPRRGSTR